LPTCEKCAHTYFMDINIERDKKEQKVKEKERKEN
jgi:hypothetical protein